MDEILTAEPENEDPYFVIGPGAILADRYRLDHLFMPEGGEGLWAATDLLATGEDGSARGVLVKFYPGRDAYGQSRDWVATLAALALSSKHVARIRKFGASKFSAFLVTDTVTGKRLDHWIEANPCGLPVYQAAPVLLGLADALTACHDHGIVLRALSPENVCFDPEAGTVRIFNFDLPSAAIEETSPQRIYASMATLQGETPATADDVFSFACVAYELLSGRHPFERLDALTASREERPPPERLENVSEECNRMLLRALAPAHDEQMPSLRELSPLFTPARMKETRPDHKAYPDPEATVELKAGSAASQSGLALDMDPAAFHFGSASAGGSVPAMPPFGDHRRHRERIQLSDALTPPSASDSSSARPRVRAATRDAVVGPMVMFMLAFGMVCVYAFLKNEGGAPHRAPAAPAPFIVLPLSSASAEPGVPAQAPGQPSAPGGNPQLAMSASPAVTDGPALPEHALPSKILGDAPQARQEGPAPSTAAEQALQETPAPSTAADPPASSVDAEAAARATAKLVYDATRAPAVARRASATRPVKSSRTPTISVDAAATERAAAARAHQTMVERANEATRKLVRWVAADTQGDGLTVRGQVRDRN